MRPLVITKTTAIYRVTQNITTEEKKEGREIYFLYSFSSRGGHKIFGQRTIKKGLALLSDLSELLDGPEADPTLPDIREALDLRRVFS